MQIELPITRSATALAVQVRAKGVLDWIEREVRLCVVRAPGTDAILFVPIIAARAASSRTMGASPAFAQQHRSVVYGVAGNRKPFAIVAEAREA